MEKIARELVEIARQLTAAGSDEVFPIIIKALKPLGFKWQGSGNNFWMEKTIEGKLVGITISMEGGMVAGGQMSREFFFLPYGNSLPGSDEAYEEMQNESRSVERSFNNGPKFKRDDVDGYARELASELKFLIKKIKRILELVEDRVETALREIVVKGIKKLPRPPSSGWSTNPNYSNADTYLIEGSGLIKSRAAEKAIVNYLKSKDKSLVPTKDYVHGSYGTWHRNYLKFSKGFWYLIAESGYSGG